MDDSREWSQHDVITPEFEFYRRRFKLTIDGQVHRFRIRTEQSFIFVAFSGITRLFEVYMPKEWELLKYMPAHVEHPPDNVLVCPMPGLVVKVLAGKGDRVFRGQNLVVLESMKMESGVASPADGVIEEILTTARTGGRDRRRSYPVQAGKIAAWRNPTAKEFLFLWSTNPFLLSVIPTCFHAARLTNLHAF